MGLHPTARKLLASPFPILGAWLLAGVLAILIPLSKWKKQRKQWYNYYGQYVEYENNQRMYEEQQNQQNQYNNGNQYNNANQGNGNYDRDGRWIPSCSWWQVKCRQQRMYYMAANGDQNQNQIRFPNWYATIGGKLEEERRDREERGENPDSASGALKFVYTWTMIVFIALLVFGSVTLFQKKPLTPLIVVMLIVGQFALLQLILLGQGVIETEGREMEDSYYGWYGQLPILMVYTDWGYFLFTICFSALLTAKIFFDRHFLKDETEPVPAESEYKTMNSA